MDHYENSSNFKKKRHKFLIGEFIPTKKNQLVQDFFKKLEFIEINKNNKIYKDLKKIDSKKKDKLYMMNCNNKKIPFVDVYEKN